MLEAPGPIALRAADIAEAHVGVGEEGGDNRGEWPARFLAAVGLKPPQAWCAAFVIWCLEQSAEEQGLTLPGSLPITGWCPSLAAWAKRSGCWIPADNPEGGRPPAARGDIACFEFVAKGDIHHVGIVRGPIDSRDGSIETVEGNTSAGTGVNRNGDGVYLKYRSRSAFGPGGGFIRLAF